MKNQCMVIVEATYQLVPDLHIIYKDYEPFRHFVWCVNLMTLLVQGTFLQFAMSVGFIYIFIIRITLIVNE